MLNGLSEFNKLAEDFFEKMINTFPHEKKITGYYALFKTTKKCHARKPVEMFMENLSPFGIQIMTRDELFFRKDEYIDHVQNLSGKIGLVGVWDSISETTKDSIWDYMQRLYVMGMAAMNRHEELAVVLQQTKEILNKN